MAKLYPPVISGTIPAFTGTTLVVPFSMNKAVGKNIVSDFSLKVKTVSGDVKEIVEHATSFSFEDSTVTFTLSEKYLVGQYYKAQIAYIDKTGIPGYYSTVGIVKYTTKPNISIEGLGADKINNHQYSYIGVYDQSGKDTTEKLYSSRFILTDMNDNIIKDSGDILHNASADTEAYIQTEEFFIPQDLVENRTYTLVWYVQSSNELSLRTKKYKIVQIASVPPQIEADVVAENEFDNGLVRVRFENLTLPNITGKFLISRAAAGTLEWEPLKRLDVQAFPADSWSFIDYTAQQGYTYKYSIQQYNSRGIYSSRLISNDVTVDFEDSFLFDGKKQLKIRFNPKVSSFKNTILEQKTDTIGNKYPFISRNGMVKYKEFPISGLISYQMDEAELFMRGADYLYENHLLTTDVLDEERGTHSDLTGKNYASERLFKLEVLEWLTDGKPKLFRSPTEGNYIVRLLNTSLSPNDTTGRMIHTFSCTAYEIADTTYEDLTAFGMIDPTEPEVMYTQYSTLDLSQYSYSNEDVLITLPSVHKLYLRDQYPGTIFIINGEEIMIGSTGAYFCDSEDGITSLVLRANQSYGGSVTYSYKDVDVKSFGLYTGIEANLIPIYQTNGLSYKTTLIGDGDNLLPYLNNLHSSVAYYNFVRFQKKELTNIFLSGEGEEAQLYSDIYCTKPVTQLDKNLIYEVREIAYDLNNFEGEGIQVEAMIDKIAPSTGEVIIGYNKAVYDKKDIYMIDIDGEKIDLTEIEKYRIDDMTNVKSIIPTEGVITEVSYTERVISYLFEETDRELAIAKKNYYDALNLYLSSRSMADLEALRLIYRRYLMLLNKAKNNYDRENGVIES